MTTGLLVRSESQIWSVQGIRPCAVNGDNMDPATFSALRNLAERHTGQRLDLARSALFASRLNGFLRRTGYSDLNELTRSLGVHKTGSNLDLQVATAMLDRYSRFVPERGAFASLLENQIEPALTEGGEARYRIWLAGCGAGQEAYSLLILLLNHLPPEAVDRIDILATDISGEALLKANIGAYNHYEVQIGMSARNLIRYFTRSGDRDWHISPDLTRKITFTDHNLLAPDDHLGLFDLVICRNVLNTMTDAHRAQARRTLERHVRPGGQLFIEP